MADEKSKQEALSSLGHLRVVFLTIHIIGGLIGLPILVVTLLFSHLTTPRQPTLINFCITWAINSIAYTLTALGGKVENASTALCFAQASMIFGAPPMSAVATFLVVLQIWKSIRNPFTPPSRRQRRCSENVHLIVTLFQPYVVYIIFLIISVGLQLKYPTSLDRRNGLYCTVSGIPLYHIFMTCLASILLRYYSGRKLIAASFPLATSTTSHGLIIRITLFNIYLIVTLRRYFFREVEAWAYMIQASVPLAAFILFATQRNVIQTWLFWLRKKEDSYSAGSVPPARQAATHDITFSLPTLSISTAET
ncbi:hypothetical protein CPB84DRAFT_1760377 [Gymnopilus junonius]|uniref:Uncharacterized protein n=1 Tax=Gymnopilus junonius TaxID=109634 RepID=A0A9P5P0P4_GYMJU|nr:hypothetical protein CPB84DRAFT_1760377 [Gymnopilus junonius]